MHENVRFLRELKRVKFTSQHNNDLFDRTTALNEFILQLVDMKFDRLF